MWCKILQGVTYLDHAPQERFFIGRVGLAMVNQCTKFEVSRFTRYEATCMNGSQNAEKGVVWGG